MERVQLENSDLFIIAHGSDQCSFPERCVIHNRSDHPMRSFPQHWRGDRGMMERVCEHGVGHPDPDHLYFVENTLGTRAAEVEAVHGCCGCCAGAPFDFQVAEDYAVPEVEDYFKEETMDDKIWADIYDIALEHAGNNPRIAADWFHETFGAADGFTDWLMEFRPYKFNAWANGYYDE